MFSGITIITIPYKRCLEKGHVYLRYKRNDIRPLLHIHKLKGDIIRCDLTDPHVPSTTGFMYEDNLLTEVSNIEHLMLDAGKMKYKERRNNGQP